MQEEYGIKLKILTDNLKNSITQVKGMIHSFKNDIKQDTEVNFTIDNNLTLKQLQKFKSDIESELAKLQQSAEIGKGMKVVDPDEERKIKNLTAGLKMVKERIAEIGNESENTKQKMSGISINANMTNNTIVNGFKNSWKSIKRFAFSLLSLRGIYGLIRKASSSYMAQDTGLAQQMQRTWASVGALVAPIIETIVKWIRIGAAYLNYFIKALTGKDLIGKAVKKINKYNKSLGGTAKAAKSVNKELTTMDEVTNLNFDDGNINNFSDGIADASAGFDDFKDIKLDPKITETLDKWAKTIKDLWEKLKPVRDVIGKIVDWGLQHPGAVLTILGGAKLLSFLTNLSGKGGLLSKTVGLLGKGGLLGALLEIGLIAGGLYIIGTSIKSIVDAVNSLNGDISANTKQSDENAKQNKKLNKIYEDGIDKHNKSNKQYQNEADLLLGLTKRRASDNKNLKNQYTLTGNLTGANKNLNKQWKNNDDIIKRNLKTLGKYYDAGVLTEEQTKDYKKQLQDQIEYYGMLNGTVFENTETGKKNKKMVEELQKQYEKLTGKKYTPKLDVDDKEAITKTTGITNILNTFKNTTYKTKVEIDKQKEKDIKNQANTIANDMKKALGIVINPKVEPKVGTKDAKNKITNFIKTTYKAMGGIGSVLNKFNEATLNSLLKAIPSYDVGTSYVPNDQLAMIHKGEAIVPKKFNNEQFFNSNNEETNALLVEVNQNLIELRNRPNVLEVNGKELAQATYNDFQNEGGRLNQSMTIKKVGGN